METLEVAQKASQMNDRVLFIAVILCLAIFILFVVRYFVKQHDSLIDDHKEARRVFESTLGGMLKESNEMARASYLCLSKNSECLQKNTETLEKVNHTMNETAFQLRKCRELQEHNSAHA